MLLLSLAMATTDMVTPMATAVDMATDMATATDTMATTARGRLSLLPLLRPPLLLSLATDTTAVDMDTVTVTAMATAMDMATVMDMATATTARGRLMPSLDMAMATDVAMDTAMDMATTVRERTDCLQS